MATPQVLVNTPESANPSKSAHAGGDLLLEVRAVSKRFGGLAALADVSLTIRRAEIYGPIGPNGAGKTTLFNTLSGLYATDSGSFVFNDKPLITTKPHLVARAGIARTFQNIRLFAHMSALENVMVGRHVRTHAGVFWRHFRSRKTRHEEAHIRYRARELLDYVGIGKRADDLAKHLPYGDQRRLEIARALATYPLLLAFRRTRRRQERQSAASPVKASPFCWSNKTSVWLSPMRRRGCSTVPR